MLVKFACETGLHLACGSTLPKARRSRRVSQSFSDHLTDVLPKERMMSNKSVRWVGHSLVAALALCCLGGALPAQDPGLALTPPMGWNSWNHFACKVSDAVVRAAADAIASNGMKDAGYVYVNIDDCWQGQRDSSGVIQANEKFPNMKALADYVNSKGLSLGIYSSPGPQTCAKYEGSYRHEAQDAEQYAKWGIDYLKYDW